MPHVGERACEAPLRRTDRAEKGRGNPRVHERSHQRDTPVALRTATEGKKPKCRMWASGRVANQSRRDRPHAPHRQSTTKIPAGLNIPKSSTESEEAP